ncbi:MAG: hypothetical protein ACFFD1_00220 [Candidatus Thorarchaeota archaeon]
MEKILIPDVEIYYNNPIPNSPFKTKKRSVQIDENGLLIEGKTYNWKIVEKVEMRFFLGNPYIFLTTTGTDSISFWFPTKWHKFRRGPWYGSSEQLTTDFIEKISLYLKDNYNFSQIDLKQEVLEKVQNSSRNIYQLFINLVYLLLPLSAITLLLVFVLWVFFIAGHGIAELG